MTKLPYGGFDAEEEPIDLRTNPKPLLAEIADCAFQGKPLRPQLARWFCRAHEEGRIRVRIPGGRPPSTPSTKQLEAVQRAQAMMTKSLKDWDGTTYTADVIEAVFAELSIEAERQTFYGWARDDQRARAETEALAAAELAADVATLTEWARPAARRHAQNGLSQSEAVARLVARVNERKMCFGGYERVLQAIVDDTFTKHAAKKRKPKAIKKK